MRAVGPGCSGWLRQDDPAPRFPPSIDRGSRGWAALPSTSLISNRPDSRRPAHRCHPHPRRSRITSQQSGNTNFWTHWTPVRAGCSACSASPWLGGWVVDEHVVRMNHLPTTPVSAPGRPVCVPHGCVVASELSHSDSAVKTTYMHAGPNT